MLTQVSNTPKGYVVEYFDIEKEQWVPLRNFGDREGDAKAFRLYDCPKLSPAQMRTLKSDYSENRKFIRLNSKRFVLQKN